MRAFNYDNLLAYLEHHVERAEENRAKALKLGEPVGYDNGQYEAFRQVLQAVENCREGWGPLHDRLLMLKTQKEDA